MKKYLIILSLLLVAEVGLTARVDIATDTYYGRIRKSLFHPIDAYQVVGVGALRDKIYTARVVASSIGGLSSYDQKLLRNQICASYKIQVRNTGSTFYTTPAPFGFYFANDHVYAIHDHALLGMPLNEGLRKLQVEDAAIKQNYAAYYYRQMRDIIINILRDNIILDDVSLSNFYIRPDGALTLLDFSSAKIDPDAGNVDSAAKVAMRKELSHTVRHMFKILFPDQAMHVLSGAESIFSAEIVNIIATNYQQANWDTAGLASDGAATAPSVLLIIPISYDIAYIINRPGNAGIVLRADHDSSQPNPLIAGFLGDNGFAVEGVLPLILDGTGAPYTDLNTMCVGWTGRE